MREEFYSLNYLQKEYPYYTIFLANGNHDFLIKSNFIEKRSCDIVIANPAILRYEAYLLIFDRGV